MTRYGIAIVLCFLLSGCATVNENAGNASDFQLLSFSQGKMTERDGEWIIYEYGEQLEFRENGRCTLNHRKVPCMWHGFILEYDSYGKDLELYCSVRETSPTTLVNPHGVMKKNARRHGFTLRLSGSQKQHINPQYLAGIFRDGTTESTTVCSIKEVEVLKFKQIMVFNRHGTQT